MSLLVSWVFAGVMVLLVLGTARRSPRRWPLWAGLAGALLTVLGSWVYPLVVEPLFNEFTPLPDGELRTSIMRAGREGARPGLRRAGGRRVPSYDDPERLRLRHRQHQAGGALRQPGRGRAGAGGPDRRGARARALPATTTSWSAPCSEPSGWSWAAACSGWCSVVAGVLDRAGVEHPGQPEVVALLLLLADRGVVAGQPGGEHGQPGRRGARGPVLAGGDRGLRRRSSGCRCSWRPGRSVTTTRPGWSQFWFGSHPTTLQRIGLARALEQRER